jgi:hypothetical protein
MSGRSVEKTTLRLIYDGVGLVAQRKEFTFITKLIDG